MTFTFASRLAPAAILAYHKYIALSVLLVPGGAESSLVAYRTSIAVDMLRLRAVPINPGIRLRTVGLDMFLEGGAIT